MYRILTKEDCLYYKKQMDSFPQFYQTYLNELKEKYNVLEVDAIYILSGNNIDDIVKSYDFTYNDLVKAGFNQEQINQILKAHDEGLNLSLLHTDTSIEQMRKIRQIGRYQ